MRLQGLFASSVLVLGGCTTLSGPPPVSGAANAELVSPGEIVTEIACELSSFYTSGRQHLDYVDSFSVDSQLTLQDTSTLGGSPGVTVTPASSPGLGIPASLTTSDQNQRQKGLGFSVTLGDIKPSTKEGKLLIAACSEPEFVATKTGLGLGDWLDSVADAMDRPLGATLTGVAYDVHFTVSHTLEGGLTFKTAIIDLEIGKESAEYAQDNELKIVFNPAPASTVVTKGGKTKTVPTPSQTIKKFELFDQLLNRPPAVTLVTPNGVPITPDGSF